MVSNEQIYDLLLNISERLSHLEQKVRCAESFPEPNTTLDEWLDNSFVKQSYIDTLISYNDGCIEAVKRFISDNHYMNAFPIHIQKRRSYVACIENEKIQWKLMDDKFEYFMREIWRKFVRFMLDNPFQNVDEDVVDVYKKTIMGLNRKICENQRNRREIQKWLSLLS